MKKKQENRVKEEAIHFGAYVIGLMTGLCFVILLFSNPVKASTVESYSEDDDIVYSSSVQEIDVSAQEEEDDEYIEDQGDFSDDASESEFEIYDEDFEDADEDIDDSNERAPLQIVKEYKKKISGYSFKMRECNPYQITNHGTVSFNFKLRRFKASVAFVKAFDQNGNEYYSWIKKRIYKSHSKKYKINFSVKPGTTIVFGTHDASYRGGHYN